MVLPARPDRASLSGMLGCLWHDVETGWSSQKDRAAIQEACASALAEWVRDFMVTRRPALTEQCNAAWEAAGAEGKSGPPKKSITVGVAQIMMISESEVHAEALWTPEDPEGGTGGPCRIAGLPKNDRRRSRSDHGLRI